jgi:hypothetical protein
MDLDVEHERDKGMRMVGPHLTGRRDLREDTTVW